MDELKINVSKPNKDGECKITIILYDMTEVEFFAKKEHATRNISKKLNQLGY